VLATSDGAEYPRHEVQADLVPLRELIRQTLVRTRSARSASSDATCSTPRRNLRSSSRSWPGLVTLVFPDGLSGDYRQLGRELPVLITAARYQSPCLVARNSGSNRAACP
jgi:hypothetical protein